jgi:hypothetical protein
MWACAPFVGIADRSMSRAVQIAGNEMTFNWKLRAMAESVNNIRTRNRMSRTALHSTINRCHDRYWRKIATDQRAPVDLVMSPPPPRLQYACPKNDDSHE